MARKYRGSAFPLPGIPHADLVELIKSFCEIRGKGATYVCGEATGDDKLLWDLNGGRRLGLTMQRELIAYFQAQLTELDGLLNAFEEQLQAAMGTDAPQPGASQPTA